MATKKTEEQKAAEAQAKAEAKAKKEAEKAAAAAAPKEPKTPAVVDEKNGVTRPSSGKTKRVWDVADEMSQALKAPVDRSSLTERLLAEGLVVGTIHTQYGKWRKYHGLVTPKEAKPAVPPAPPAPAQ